MEGIVKNDRNFPSQYGKSQRGSPRTGSRDLLWNIQNCDTTLHNDRLLLSNCAIYAIKLFSILSTRQ